VPLMSIGVRSKGKIAAARDRTRRGVNREVPASVHKHGGRIVEDENIGLVSDEGFDCRIENDSHGAILGRKWWTVRVLEAEGTAEGGRRALEACKSAMPERSC